MSRLFYVPLLFHLVDSRWHYAVFCLLDFINKWRCPTLMNVTKARNSIHPFSVKMCSNARPSVCRTCLPQRIYFFNGFLRFQELKGDLKSSFLFKNPNVIVVVWILYATCKKTLWSFRVDLVEFLLCALIASAFDYTLSKC